MKNKFKSQKIEEKHFRKNSIKKEEKKGKEDDDWYKEVEAMITEEAKLSKQKSSSVARRKKRNEEIKNPTIYEENSNLNRMVFSNDDLKVAKTLKKVKNDINHDKKKSKFYNNENILKSSKTVYGNGNNTKGKRVMSSKLNTAKDLPKNIKTARKSDKKIDEINDYFSKSKIPNNKTSLLQSSKTTKHTKVVKKDNQSLKMSMKMNNKNHAIIKKYELGEDDDDDDYLLKNVKGKGRRGLSCAKRSQKFKA